MQLRSWLLLLVLAWASPAAAQVIRFPSVEIGTVAVGCRYQSLNVTDDNPNGDVTGSICDQVNETTTGVVWTKTSGMATTSGWVALTTSATTGTVTSVALTAPGIFSVAGTPITTSGTLALSLATQSAKTFFAGPASGSAAAPTFRQPVLADLAQSSATTGQIPKWDGTVWAAADDAGASSGAPVGVQYVTLATDATLTNERVLTAGSGITLTDGGAGSTLTVASTGGSGAVVQVENTQTGEVATGTTTVPPDDTIPQNTEGDEYLTLAITPTSAGNKLKIEVVFVCSMSNINTPIVALFQDSTADALAASWMTTDAALNLVIISFSHYMTSGTASATTFKVRAGPAAAGTLTFNGQSGARKLGGVSASSITITEIVP